MRGISIWRRGLPILLLTMSLGKAATAQEVRILTSYDSDVVQPVIEAFERLHPSIRVRALNKNTNAAVDEILGGNDRRFDLLWASAPEAFEVLREADRLADLGQGLHVDFALSALGWAWKALPAGTELRDWNDLLDPALAGQIGMSHPMRAGTMHSLIETILQDRGWVAGWAWVLELAGQLNTISARSFGVLEGVERGNFKLGLTIDFLALTRAGQGLEFRYGRPVILIPARIAGLVHGASPEAAGQFIDFLVSPEGQALLLRPEIRRIPIDPVLQAELAATAPAELQAALRFSWSRYDPRLAAQRYWEVKQLFETFAARDFLRRRDLWRRLRNLDYVADRDEQRVRRLLTWMPLTEHQARSAPKDRETLLLWAERSHGLLSTAEAMIRALEERP